MTISNLKCLVKSSCGLGFREKLKDCVLILFYNNIAFELMVEPKDKCMFSKDRIVSIIRYCLDTYKDFVFSDSSDTETVKELNNISMELVRYSCGKSDNNTDTIKYIVDSILHDLHTKNYIVEEINDSIILSGWNN